MDYAYPGHQLAWRKASKSPIEGGQSHRADVQPRLFLRVMWLDSIYPAGEEMISGRKVFRSRSELLKMLR